MRDSQIYRGRYRTTIANQNVASVTLRRLDWYPEMGTQKCGKCKIRQGPTHNLSLRFASVGIGCNSFALSRSIAASNDMKTALKSSRIVGFAILTLVLIGLALWAGISHLQEVARIDFERTKSEWRQKWFDDVKGGKHYATIMDPKIIPMLANDSDCVQNTTELHFWMVTIEPNDAPPIEQLVPK
jgi:hypothetical protein